MDGIKLSEQVMAMDSLDMPLVKSSQKVELILMPQATDNSDMLSSDQLFNQPNKVILVEKETSKKETFSFDFG